MRLRFYEPPQRESVRSLSSHSLLARLQTTIMLFGGGGGGDCRCEFRANRASQQSGFETELFSAEAIFNTASLLTYRVKAYTGVQVFMMSKVLCALLWYLHSLPFLPLSTLWCKF